MINIDEIIEINKKFYSDVGFEFDQTRKVFWPGGDKILTFLKDKSQNILVADIGCGNGRFAEFLLNNGLNFSYTGFDTNDFLLDKANEKFNLNSNIKFINHDCVKNLESIKNKYDLVVAFGVTHHIPSYEFRKKWFRDLADLVEKDGILTFSNWRIDTIQNFKDKIIKTDIILEDNDYFIGWDDSLAKRYIHIYKEEEIQTIISLLKDKGLLLKQRFLSDGRTNELNEYFVFVKC